ncbi:MAG: exodeoxyribonuclease V subunit beta [Planctomycetota bacterium]
MKQFRLTDTPIESGTTLIEASAGTGKTYTLTGLVLRLILEKDIRLPEILVVTFTIAATDELKGRIRSRLTEALAAFEGAPTDDPLLEKLIDTHGKAGGERLRHALLELDEVGIHTIHAFCKRMLEDSAFESGLPFQAQFVEEEWMLLRACADDFWRNAFYDAGPVVASLIEHRGWLPDTFIPPLIEVLRTVDPIIRPKGEPLQDVIRDMQRAYEEAQSAWCADTAAAVELLGFRSSKSKPLTQIPREELARRAAAFLDDPARELEAALFVGEQRPYKRDDAAWNALGDKALGGVLALQRFQDAAERFTAALRSTFLKEVSERFRAAKDENRTLTFDDLLSHLSRALADDKAGARVRRAIRSKFQVALIDEFQDTDQRQWDIFSQLFADRMLFLIGDPKQAIYSFRGADVFTYLEAQRSADRAYGLTTNWRSRQPLISAINALFGQSTAPFAIEEISYQPVEAAPGAESSRLLDGAKTCAMQWWLIPEEVANRKPAAEAAVIRATCAEIVRLLEAKPRLGDGELQPRDIAVLVRTNEQAQAVQDALREARVPAIVSNTNDIWASKEMAELERLLQAIHDPRSPSRLRAAWSTELWGDDAQSIWSLSEDTPGPGRGDGFEERVQTFEDWRSQWSQRGFAPMMFDVLAKQQVRSRLLGLPDGERRLTNLMHCIELIHQERGEQGGSAEGLLQWLHQHRHQQDHHGEAAELRLESDERAVKILTIHKSKGLEYEVVFCPFLYSHSKPRSGKAAHELKKAHSKEGLVFDFEPDAAFAEMAHQESLAEDLRIAYVAITRAKERCYIPIGGVGNGRSYAHQVSLGHLLGPATAFDAKAEWEPVLERLQALAAEHPEMAVALLPQPKVSARLSRPGDGSRELAPREYTQPSDRLATWRLASFSSLKTGAESRERPDHFDPPEPMAAVGHESGFVGFARGARAGTCLHEILEHVDFTLPGSEPSRAVIRERLSSFGLEDPERHPACSDPEAAVLEMVEKVVGTEIPGFDWRLRDLPEDHRLVEWAFHLPLSPLTPNRLADVFEKHARGVIRDEYAERLRLLSPDELRGFLLGFVDLVAHHDGRWAVLDWKSNHLGGRAEDYDADGLWRAMSEHHYVLQYHLYTVGLHRYLRTRLPDYDYDREIEGVAYVFLRGVALDPARGWFVDRPPRALIEGLDHFLETGEA